MIISGIYKIQSKINPKRVYIGSSFNIHKRWQVHLNNLKHNNHHSIKLQRHFNKYGKNDLVFSIIIGCDKEDLITTEQFYLDGYRPYFNNCLIANSRLGIKASKETKNKLSQAHKGMSGLHHSEETKKKMSEAWKKRKPVSEETKLKMSKAQKGHYFKHSEETKQKLSESHKNKPTWNKGKTGCFSIETRNKISQSLKGNIPWNKGKKMIDRSLILKIA